MKLSNTKSTNPDKAIAFFKDRGGQMPVDVMPEDYGLIQEEAALDWASGFAESMADIHSAANNKLHELIHGEAPENVVSYRMSREQFLNYAKINRGGGNF